LNQERKPREPDDFPAGLPQPALRALRAAGYTRLEQLAGVREATLLGLHGVGPKALRIIQQALAGRGLPPLAS
jgi:hypothetical protein